MSSLAGVETGSIVNLNYGMRLHGLWLDANGERFFDEETNYENPTGHRAIVRKQNEQGTPPIALLGTTPELDAMQATYPLKWSTAETVEEVAAMVGLDGAKVKATVERYNGFCEAGKDEDFGRPADLLVPMTGPFYAAPIMVSTSVTLGGFKTDENAQALRLVKPANGRDGTLPGPVRRRRGMRMELRRRRDGSQRHDDGQDRRAERRRGSSCGLATLTERPLPLREARPRRALPPYA